MKLGINFISPEVEEMYREAGFQDNISSGFDLMNIEDVFLSVTKPYALINLGVNIKPPEGYHSILMMRSSTYKKFNIIQTNAIGLIDENFCGEEDVWKLPALYYPPDTYVEENAGVVMLNLDTKIRIPKGTRICQFILQPVYRFETYKYVPGKESRGGNGSTNKK